MDKNLTYQKAKRIRGTSLTDLLTDQLLYEPSIGKAIKRTLSLKTQSKIKGIKEKFDPLNIAKFLTGGSKLAPALLGRMTGRNIRDIEYFTGRNRPIRIGSETASKIKPLEQGQEDFSAINEHLLKIYKFLRSSNENELKRSQKEQNFQEELQMEAEKRHEKFIRELRKILQQYKTTTPIIEQESENEGDSIFDNILDRFGRKSSGKTRPGDLRKSRQSKVRRAKIGRATKQLGRLLVNPVTGVAAVVAGTGYLTAQAIDKYANTEKGVKSQINAQEQIKNNYQKQLDLIEKTDKSMFTPEQIAAGRTTDPRKDQLKKRIEEANQRLEELQKQLEQMQSEKNKGLPDESSAETKRLLAQNEAAGKQTTPTTATPTGGEKESPPKASMVPQSSSNQLNTVMKENVEANLPSSSKTIIENKQNNIVPRPSDSIQLDSLSELGVRNDEPSFMRMIMGSTRVV